MHQSILFGDASTPQIRQVAVSEHQRAVDGWHQLWRERRGEEWKWAPIDVRAIKMILQHRTSGLAAPLLERAHRLIVFPPSPWFFQNASPTLLYSKWNEIGQVANRLTRDQHNLSALRSAIELL